MPKKAAATAPTSRGGRGGQRRQPSRRRQKAAEEKAAEKKAAEKKAAEEEAAQKKENEKKVEEDAHKAEEDQKPPEQPQTSLTKEQERIASKAEKGLLCFPDDDDTTEEGDEEEEAEGEKAQKKKKRKTNTRGDEGRRDAMLEAALPHVVKVVSVGKSAWKTWVQESDQGNKGHRLESFYKYDRWANTSCRSEQLTVEEQDFKWCFSLTLRQAIFPAILGADREKVPNMKDLRRSKKLRPVYSALLAFLQQFTTEKLLDVPYAFTVAHTLESIQELLTRPVTQYKHHLRKGGGLVRVDEGPATKEENDEDLEKALIANSGLSREVSGTRWCCPRCNKYKNLNSVKLCSGCGHPCTYDMRGKKIDWTKFRACDNPLCSYMLPPTCTLCPICQVRQLATPDEAELRVPKDAVPKDAFYLREEREEYVPDEEWDPDALDAVPPPKWVQEEAGVPRAAERSPPGAIFGVKLHPDTVLVEVEEIRGNHNVSPTLRMGPDTHASVNGKIKQVLQEHWTGTPAANSKIFTNTIGMDRLREKFHEQGKRCMMLFNICAWLRPNLIEHRQSWVNVWCYGESVAWAGLKRDKKREDIEKRCKMSLPDMIEVAWGKDQEFEEVDGKPAVARIDPAPESDEEFLFTERKDAGRVFLAHARRRGKRVRRTGHQRCLSHDQANVMCPQNVLHHPRERLQRVLYTPSSKHSSSSCSIAKNMLNAGKHKIITHHDVKFGKGMWHMVHFWGNDYSKANSLTPNPQLFFPCFESVNDRVNGNPRLLFTNAREKKVPYTGKVQDRDFQLGTEIFDDGVKQRDRGMRMSKESWDGAVSLARLYNKKISFSCLE
eukprot:g36506.t1